MSQQLVMTPQLQQAIKLLQMSRMELVETVHQELLENPVLEDVREPALVGSAEVVRAAYPDPAQFDAASPLHDPASKPAAPLWYCIDIRYRAHFPHPVTLAAIRACADLAAMVLLRQGRLSVQPVTLAEWRLIAAMAGLAPA